MTLNNSGMFDSLLKKCGLTCGDFIELVTAWENLKQIERQNSDSNLKKAANIAENDLFQTPTSDCIMKHENNPFSSSATNSLQDSDSLNMHPTASKPVMTDQETQTEEVKKEETQVIKKPVLVGQKRTLTQAQGNENEDNQKLIACSNKKRAEKLLQKVMTSPTEKKPTPTYLNNQTSSFNGFKAAISNVNSKAPTPTFMKQGTGGENETSMKVFLLK